MSTSTTSDIRSVPADVWCVIDRDHRDRSVADLARAGRFVHHGVELDLGWTPDWLGGGLSSDPEWRIEWVKFYEGLHLGHAFQVTGDPEYLRTWRDLVLAFCEQVPVGHDASDVSARRIQNWLYSWQRLRAATAHLGPEEARITHRIRADVDHLWQNLTSERNHRTLELYTLLLASLALDAGRSRVSEALELLAENAATDIWPDGVHRECSTDYHHLVLRSLIGAIGNARRYGYPVPQDLLAGADRACDFAIHVQRPDGLTPALSDGDVADFRDLLADCARLLDRPDALWVATGGRDGRPPGARNASFMVGGYHSQRSGWGERWRRYDQEAFAILDCGPLGDGGHGHYDQLSVEVHAGGRPLLVDPGRYTYAADDDGWRHWFKGTAAHNTATVDGLDQVEFRPGKPKGDLPQARLVGRWTGAEVDVLVAEGRSPTHDATHRRWVALVGGDYWIVRDRLEAPTLHEYAVRWHLAPAAWGRVSLQRRSHGWVVTAPGLALVIDHEGGDVRIEDGWVSSTYGVKERAPVVVIRSERVTTAEVVTVVDPSGTPPYLTAEALGHGLLVDIERSGAERDLLWVADSDGATTVRRLR